MHSIIGVPVGYEIVTTYAVAVFGLLKVGVRVCRLWPRCASRPWSSPNVASMGWRSSCIEFSWPCLREVEAIDTSLDSSCITV